MNVMAEHTTGESYAGAGRTSAPPQSNVYVVQKGDTMSGIAKKHGVSLSALEKANPEMGPPKRDYNKIFPGDRVKIPAK